MTNTTDLTRTLDNGLTVQQLIDYLQEFDPDTKVAFHYDSGDYWKTRIADPVTCLEEIKVEYSGYHNTLKLAQDSDDDYDGGWADDADDGKTVSVVALGNTNPN